MNADLQSIKARFGIIGNAPALNHAIEVAAQVSGTDMTVLISGESGSGKESFSKIIHNLSHRKHGQFIAINCGAIPEGTIDSELFGHVKGSFTGALDDRKGYFEVTDGGTIFLDEVAEMPLGTQARLLRVLETGEFIRVGSSKVQKTNVRVVAATNVNLLEAIGRGRFREDLYYRLNTVPIAVPPLRERGIDIELLFRKFTSDFSDKYRVKAIQLTPDAVELLLTYRFPGNIRQLKNIAEQISLLEMNARVVDAPTLRKYLPENQRSQVPNLFAQTAGTESDFSERDILYRILFDLKRDVTEMKKIILEIVQNGGTNLSEVVSQHPDIFSTKATTEYSPSRLLPTNGVSDFADYQPPINRSAIPEAPFLTIDDNLRNRSDIIDVSHETQEEGSLSLDKKEKEMIVLALRKNRNKRKYAAEALGISERTLYRKIKQYGIDEEED